MRHLLLAIALIASPAAAQFSNPTPPDLSPYATKTDVQAAADIASSAQTLAASKCNPTVAVPRAEVVGGLAGSGSACTLVTAAPARISRTDVFAVTGSLGMVTVVWDNPLPATTSAGVAYGSYPVFFTPIAALNSAPAKWKVITGSATNTGFQAQCSQEVNTLNFTLSALTAAALTGLSLPLNVPCPAGTQVFALQLPSAK